MSLEHKMQYTKHSTAQYSTAQHSNIFIRNWFTEAINWWTDTINTTLFNFYLTVLWDAMKWLIHARLTQHCAFLYSLDMVQTLWIYTPRQYVVRAHCTAQIFILLLMAPNVWHNCINNMNVLLWVLLKKIYTLFFQARFYSFRRFFCIFLCLLFRELSEIIRVYLILGVEFYLWDRDRETQIKIAWERIYF